MTRINIAPVVEGHGDQESVRILLTRIWVTIAGGEYANVLKPVRFPKTKLLKPEELVRAVDIAATKLRHLSNSDPQFVLVLFDADEDVPCVLAPKLMDVMRTTRSHLDVAIVVANVEYETWFVAAAESLAAFLKPNALKEIPADPESGRFGKGWVQRNALRYAEVIEQPRMTALMDLTLCRSRSASFDKLCRELEARVSPGAAAGSPAVRS